MCKLLANFGCLLVDPGCDPACVWCKFPQGGVFDCMVGPGARGDYKVLLLYIYKTPFVSWARLAHWHGWETKFSWL